MDLARIRTTPRRLVFRELGVENPSPSTVRLALNRARNRGYLVAYHPAPPAYDEPLVQVPVSSPMAALYRWLAVHPPLTPMPRGMVESRTGWELSHPFCGSALARVSLAIVKKDGFTVVLRPAPLQFCHRVNASRYPSVEFAHPCAMLVAEAIGLRIHPILIGDELRLKAALIYDEYGIDVDGLLDGKRDSTLRSRWQFAHPMPMAEHLDPPF